MLPMLLYRVYSHCDIKTSDVTVVAGILRISIKYEVTELRRRSIDALRRAYPISLDRYHPARAVPHFNPAISPARRLYVVDLLRETKVPALLPCALLFCCDNATEDILDGTTYNGVHIKLSTEDKRAVLMGHQRLTTERSNGYTQNF